MVYAFVIDWRLGLLSIATLPVYALITWWMTKDMGPKTAEMDQHLAEVSATMVEFVTGITVVKAFGRVGDTHARSPGAHACRTYGQGHRTGRAQV